MIGCCNYWWEGPLCWLGTESCPVEEVYKHCLQGCVGVGRAQFLLAGGWSQLGNSAGAHEATLHDHTVVCGGDLQFGFAQPTCWNTCNEQYQEFVIRKRVSNSPLHCREHSRESNMTSTRFMKQSSVIMQVQVRVQELSRMRGANSAVSVRKH